MGDARLSPSWGWEDLLNAFVTIDTESFASKVLAHLGPGRHESDGSLCTGPPEHTLMTVNLASASPVLQGGDSEPKGRNKCS